MSEHEPTPIGKLLKKFESGLKEIWAEQERLRPEIEAAEADLRARIAAGRREGFPVHAEACGAPEHLVEPYRRGIRSTPALDAVKAWLETDTTCLVLLGVPGAGKSVAAVYALKGATKTVRMMAHPKAPDFTYLEDFSSSAGCFLTAAELRTASRYSDGRAWSLLEESVRVKVLVLDELRASDFNGVGLERLEEILGARHARKLRTVITTNLTQSELKRAVGDRLSSRFKEAKVVELGGQDMRGAK